MHNVQGLCFATLAQKIATFEQSAHDVMCLFGFIVKNERKTSLINDYPREILGKVIVVVCSLH